jgi:hypothetical protein
MSTAPDEDALKRRYREFLDLLPLTLSLAGLSSSDGMRNFTTEQLDLRAQVILNAFKVARQTARDAIRAG